MPQMFQVLRCYKCLVFQVHQTNKSNRFQCKMCGEKQSIKRHYGLGNGQECRKHVQKLNGIRGEMDESKSFQSISTDDESENIDNIMPVVKTHKNQTSKWSEYVKGDDKNDSDNDTMYLDNTEVVLELPKKRRKMLDKNLDTQQSTVITANSVNSPNDGYATSFESKHLTRSSICHMQSGNATKNIHTSPIKKENTQTPNLHTVHSTQCEQHDNEILNLVEIETSKNTHIARKKFVPPALDKNSKWAKYAEEDDDEKNESEEDKQFYSKGSDSQNAHSLFSSCNENDLDDYLTI